MKKTFENALADLIDDYLSYGADRDELCFELETAAAMVLLDEGKEEEEGEEEEE